MEQIVIARKRIIEAAGEAFSGRPTSADAAGEAAALAEKVRPEGMLSSRLRPN